MAVIQISKIQQRRGQRNLSGMPQLSSAEFAWAVDTQELYIGNGSISEGAPYVGNTRILTEHDNILELASSYRFASTDLTINGSVFRSLQSKLDEIEVSVLDFGAPPDPSTDHSEAFALAFQELFQNTDTKFRKVLKVPNGTYLFTSVLRIPSNVIIRGETRDGVILDVNSNGIEFLSAANTDQFGFSSTDRPENISISNLTISYTVGETNLTGVKNTVFDNVKFVSEYILGDTVATPVLASQTYELSGVGDGGNITISGTGITTSPFITIFASNTVSTINTIVDALNADNIFDNRFVASRVAESLVITEITESGLTASDITGYFTITTTANGTASPVTVTPTATEASTGIDNVPAALAWNNTLFGTRTTDIKFIACRWESVPLAIKCTQTSAFETEITFDDCEFFVVDTGVYISGTLDSQVNNWSFSRCHFEEIAKQAIVSIKGTGTIVHGSTVKNCGNGVNGAANPETPIFEFGTKFGNIVRSTRSDRHQYAGITLLDNTVGISESLNSGNTELINDYSTDIYFSDTFTPLAVFSSSNRFIIIDYILTLSNNVRKGIITMSIDDTMTDIAIADNYTYSPSLITDPGGAMMTKFEFNAELKDNDADSGIDTVLLTYKNPLATGATGTISYSISYGV